MYSTIHLFVFLILVISCTYGEITLEKNEESTLFSKLSSDEYNRIRNHLLNNDHSTRNYNNRVLNDMSDLSSQQDEKNATISLTVSSVTAFSVEAIISVSVPSHVWCQALKQGEYFNTEKLLSSGRKQYISKSATTEISSLSPSTKYSLRCIAVPYEEDLPNAISKEYLFSTNPAHFAIKNIHRWSNRITYSIDCNIRAVAVCYLLTKKPEVLDTFEFTTSRDHHVTFKRSTNLPLLTKCELYDSNNNLLMSTRVEDIDPILPFWKVFLVILIIVVLAMVAVYLWIHRKIYDPTLEIVNEEDVEKLQLLKKVVSISPTTKEVDVVLEANNTIQCQRCGYINSDKSTVCRECNALLKGQAFFNHSRQPSYY